ncbi:putative P450 monooxygenase [Aspergillus unguis]
MSPIPHLVSRLEGTLGSITVSTVFLSIAALIVVQFVYQIIYYRFFHPLRHYPGPFWAGVTRIWGAYHYLMCDEAQVYWNAVQKYGPVVRISPTMLLLADSIYIPIIYHRKCTKSRWYMADWFATPGSLMIRDTSKHAPHRRLVGATYSLSNLQRMESLIDRHILRWMDKLESAYVSQGQPVDLSKWTAYLSYDTITDVGFRKPLGFIDQGRDVDGLIQGFNLGSQLFGAMGRCYPFFEWLPRTRLGKKYVTIKPGNKMGFGVVMDRASAVLEERTKALKEGKIPRAQKGEANYDFLQAFMDARTAEGDYFDAEAIQMEMFIVLGAGSDGFSGSCSAFLIETLKDARIFNRLMAEIKDAVEAGHLTQPVPTYNEVTQHLPYFMACIREVMRLHPVSSTLLPREITPTDPDVFIGGRKIPLGTELACNPWISHRDQGIYGPDAEVYNPDRWLDPEKAKIYEKYNLAFGAGSRVCLGKHFALMMIYKAPLALYMAFEPALCPDTKQTPWPSRDPKGAPLLWKDVWVKLKRREPWTVKSDKNQTLDAVVESVKEARKKLL